MASLPFLISLTSLAGELRLRGSKGNHFRKPDCNQHDPRWLKCTHENDHCSSFHFMFRQQCRRLLPILPAHWYHCIFATPTVCGNIPSGLPSSPGSA